MTVVKYPSNSVIVKAGAPMPNLHVVHKGTIASKSEVKGGASGPGASKREASSFAEGSFFGEAALLGSGARLHPIQRPSPPWKPAISIQTTSPFDPRQMPPCNSATPLVPSGALPPLHPSPV